MSDQQRPSVGRIVHYRPDGKGTCWAAIVTEVLEEGYGLWLTVFPPDKLPGHLGAPAGYSPEQWQEHTWHWPERE